MRRALMYTPEGSEVFITNGFVTQSPLSLSTDCNALYLSLRLRVMNINLAVKQNVYTIAKSSILRNRWWRKWQQTHW